jgi:hypothetical protein
MRWQTRLLLLIELLFGLLPVTASYLYHWPVGVFWTGRVLELAGEGIGNAYTSGVAIAFIAGGIGLLGVWIALVGRFVGRSVSNQLVYVGVLVGVALGVALLLILPLADAWWPEYFLVGAPLLVAIHQGYAITRSTGPTLRDASARIR